jgi:agmatinase
VMRRLREEKVRLVQVGTRSLSRAEYDFAVRDEGITVFFAHEMGEKWGELRETLRQLKGDVYLSIDVDGFDPAVVPNTGAPQPNGLTWNQAIEIIQQISLSEGSRFLGADVVEYVASPHPPGCDIVVAKLAAKILAYWFAAKDKRPRPSTP